MLKTPIDQKTQKMSLPGYYWRDYFGVLPKDAIQGGRDLAGNPTYIGQAYFHNYGLLPGTIVEDSELKLSASGLGTALTAKKNIKILCCSNETEIQWIRTNSTDITALTNTRPIPGGILNDYDLYIGRALFEGKTVVGHIMYNEKYAKGLYLPNKAVDINIASFEILMHFP